MELIMEIILGIVSIILGTALFWMLNSMFSITYFGFGAMVSLWIGCFVVSLLIIGGIGKLLLGVLKWIIIIKKHSKIYTNFIYMKSVNIWGMM